MKTNSLVPPVWNLKIGNDWSQIIMFGSENLTAMRAYWRNKERDLGSRIKRLQGDIDFLKGGPNNHASMTQIESIGPEDRDTTFCRCSGCSHAKQCGSAAGLCRCELMARISKICHFKDYSHCKFFYSCKDGNKKIVAALTEEKKELSSEKKLVNEHIAELSKAISEAKSKPLLSFLRNEHHFTGLSTAIVFVIQGGVYTPCRVTLESKYQDYDNRGYVTYKEVIDLSNLTKKRPDVHAVQRKSPQILTSEEYHYLIEHPDFCRLWIDAIDDDWLRNGIGKALKVL
ncbi:hypothetical protein IKX12_00475 [Candidatus Saccharibacteria bacterium]|nr:hypothetical protein [Candidatus Saccharibacteria bacterium]